MNIQAMRDHLATEIMKLTLSDTKAAWHTNGKFFCWVAQWTPDINPAQRDMVMNKFDNWAFGKQEGERHYCVIFSDVTAYEIISESTGEESQGMACMIAACRASGYEV